MDLFSTLRAGGNFTKKARAPRAAPEAKPVVSLAPSRTSQNGRKRAREDILSDAASGGLDLFADDAGTAVGRDRGKKRSGSKVAEESSSAARQSAAEAVAAFRRKLRIKVDGEEVPPPISTFSDMPAASLSRKDNAVAFADARGRILRNIEAGEWKEPTPIQMQAIPVLLKGRDLLASAPTGSGKTAAFLLPILASLGSASKAGVRAVFLAPTKELAAQIHREAERLSKGTGFKACLLTRTLAAQALTGGSGFPLRTSDILVSTPMRLVASLSAGALSLNRAKYVVLDEADKLFDLGRDGQEPATTFIAQVDQILAHSNSRGVVRAMFSATIGPQVSELANGVLRDPVHISIGTTNAGADTIDQELMFVGREEGKLVAFRQLVQAGLEPPVLVFLQSKERAQALFRELVYDGISVDAIHADRTPEQRASIMTHFRSGDIWVLICTDLMARGIDFKGVNMVINYDLPQSPVQYIHRIGRTGRAGRRGKAVTFFTEKDMGAMRSIANVMRISGCEVPDWMLSLKRPGSREVKRMRVSAPRRKPVEAPKFLARRQRRTPAAASSSAKRRSPGGGEEAKERAT
jgi:ATP-dependent RNA helicase DDX52/ROK1